VTRRGSHRPAHDAPLFDELDPETRERLASRLGPDAQLSAFGSGFDHVDAEHRRNASRRKRMGNQLEQDLARDHALYFAWRKAYVEQMHAPTKKIRHPRSPGGWRVIYTGPASVDWVGAAPGVGLCVFDSKSFDGATYAHAREQWHQLEALLHYARMSSAACVVRAFLFLADQGRGLAYVVEGSAIEEHYHTARPIVLREGRHRTTVHHFPVVRRPGGLMVPPNVVTWDWLAALTTTAGPPTEAR
jgi:hypothetical protein